MTTLKRFNILKTAIMYKEGFIEEFLYEKISRLFSVVFGMFVSVEECKELEEQSIIEYREYVKSVLG